MTTVAIKSIRAQSKIQQGISNLSLEFLCSICIALAAQISSLLPFTPVPFTIHMNLILLFAAYLGAKRATRMVFFYLLQGALGFPVFAAGGFGIHTLLGPRGGYLMGFALAAFVVGLAQEKIKNKTPWQLFCHMGIGNLVVYLCGYIWLTQFLGIQKAFLYGVVPFILGDFLKLIVFTKLSRLGPKMCQS